MPWHAALACAFLVASGPAFGEDAAWTLRLLPEWHGSRDASPFSGTRPLLSLGHDRSTEELELRTAVDRLDLIATARSTARQGTQTENKLVLNQAAVELDTGAGRFGFGKKIFSWDVGVGFRPLDLVEREDRRAMLPGTLEGVPYLAWQTFSADSSWLLLFANPGRGETADPFDEESVALKGFRRRGNVDLHAVARLSRRYGLEGGAASSWVVDDSVELHASGLLQQRHERQANGLVGSTRVLTASDPVTMQRRNGGAKALVGFTWSSAGGTSIIGEAWYDDSAPTVSDWRATADLARRQAALRGVVADAVIAGNLAYGARAFEQANLLRGNLLLHVSRRTEGSDWEPAFDLLETPADGGWAATATLAFTRDRYRMDAGLRCFGGPSQAAYRLLPERRVAFLGVRLAL